MTCDDCFAGNHWRCRGCECNICKSRRAKAPPVLREVKKVKVKKPKVRDRTGERARYYQSPVSAEQRRLRDRLGVLTRFTPNEVERIFQAKATGVSISELAREFRTTRDKIRTVYNCKAAPEFVPKAGPLVGALRFTTIREEFDGKCWQVAYRKQWSNSSR